MRRILVIIPLCIFLISSLSGCSNRNLNNEAPNKSVESLVDDEENNQDKNTIYDKKSFLRRYNLLEFKNYKLEEGTEYLEKIDPTRSFLRLYDNNGVLLESLSVEMLNRLNTIAKIFDGKYTAAPVGWTTAIMDEEGYISIDNENNIQGISKLNIPYVLVEDNVFMNLSYYCGYNKKENRFEFSCYIHLKSDEPIKEATIINNLYKNNLVDLISYYEYDEETDEEYYAKIYDCINDLNIENFLYYGDNKEYYAGHSKKLDKDGVYSYIFNYGYEFYIDCN